MKLAFVRADKGSLLDKLIDLCSGQYGYSHVEFVFSDGVTIGSRPKTGVFSEKERKDSHAPPVWELIDISVSPEQEAVVRAACESQLGHKYDWFGVFGFILPFDREKGRWFCSELVVWALQHIGLLPGWKSWKVSPNKLHGLVPHLFEGINAV